MELWIIKTIQPLEGFVSIKLVQLNLNRRVNIRNITFHEKISNWPWFFFISVTYLQVH